MELDTEYIRVENSDWVKNAVVTVRISTETQCGVTIWKPYSDGLMFGLVVK